MKMKRCSLISESPCDSVDLGASVVKVVSNIYYRDAENH
jgi:hypothetical protein